MKDRYADQGTGLSSPATTGFAVVPANADLPEITRAVYIGRGGDLVLQMQDGAVLTFANIADGTTLCVRAVRVLPATSASAILGLC